MNYDDQRHAAAIDALPALLRTVYRLHNLHDVDLGTIADKLATDEASILACLAVARAMIHRHLPSLLGKPHDPVHAEVIVTRLEQRLRQDYRASLEAVFAESGYAGTLPWPDPATTIEADEEAAATFVVTFLRDPLRIARERSTKAGVATVDLWQHARPWRRILRDRLLQVTGEIRCSGWQEFDIWLADRIASDRYYPSGINHLPRRRRPLPEELTPPEDRYLVPYWPDDRDKQRRFDNLPSLTRHVYSLFNIYGRNSYEISRRLGISRRSVRRRVGQTIYAIIGWPRSPLRTIIVRLRMRWNRVAHKMRRVWAVSP